METKSKEIDLRNTQRYLARWSNGEIDLFRFRKGLSVGEKVYIKWSKRYVVITRVIPD